MTDWADTTSHDAPPCPACRLYGCRDPLCTEDDEDDEDDMVAWGCDPRADPGPMWTPAEAQTRALAALGRAAMALGMHSDDLVDLSARFCREMEQER